MNSIGSTLTDAGVPPSAIALLTLLVVVAVVAAVCAVVSVIYEMLWGAYIAVLRNPRSHVRRDARRVYTQREKDEAAAWCKYRCEGTGLLFRCTKQTKNLQGDHWFPHARGGATTKRNLVMLCPECNKKKSAKVPTPLQTFALRMRRRGKGYTHPEKGKAGQWLPLFYKDGKEKNTARPNPRKDLW